MHHLLQGASHAGKRGLLFLSPPPTPPWGGACKLAGSRLNNSNDTNFFATREFGLSMSVG